ncbi:hypothetical protein K435DRAFT_748560 [Dendrothele bispora CBS 962.96]|uniref:Needs CLA4 to survive protein 3 n=1 Tax=Dendrothele bispora (strain CBS 962.96) TaxID=1314807 RepID=A0A4S8MJ32_DENBC|nr:hypothetical protein K435DRAFT_748560 [Dendrothele bispora CBS 962.96]
MENQLVLDEYRRYGRQMILEGLGLQGQLKLKQASVVVVGAGGLGCPALQYLAASGIGKIGIIDHDVVELSNLQRQVLHNEQTIDMPKAQSAAIALKRLDSKINLDVVTEALAPGNAVALLSPYDVILDCTDNPPTRYLLSDTAVALGKPLVSGAAQKFEGQLAIYNFGKTGPCYRCLFPKPPAPEHAGTCEETGILGAVTGVIGNLQALEAIKIITGLHDGSPTLLLFSALGIPPFRNVKLRSRRPTCPACGEEGRKLGEIRDIDYVQFCGGATPNWEKSGLVEGSPQHRISVKDLKRIVNNEAKIKIIDVRSTTEFGICHLPDSTNVPLKNLVSDPHAYLPEAKTQTYIVCRLGNDSQIAADTLRSLASENTIIKDVIGGLRAWSRHVDPDFPVY